MKKMEETVKKRDIDDFEGDVHLWNMISGGTGRGLTLLKKIVDATFANTGKSRMPRVLIIGVDNSGANFHARALARSFCLFDIREIPCRYLGAGNNNPKEFFSSNGLETSHLIYDVTEMKPGIESILWQFLKIGWMQHDTPLQNDTPPDFTYCNGLMVLTATDMNKVGKQIIDAVDFIVQLEPYTVQQLELIVLQRLKYCNIGYENERGLKNIVKNGESQIEKVIRFLKICLTIVGADGREEITEKDVELAGKLK